LHHQGLLACWQRPTNSSGETGELQDQLRKAIARLRHKVAVIQGFTCKVYRELALT
jgi:hypothetical protein